MKNKTAELINWNSFRIQLEDNEPISKIDFFIDSKKVSIKRISDGIYSFDYSLDILGKDLYLIINQSKVTVSVLKAPLFDNFDDKYAYSGFDLGATYHKDFTEFVLWAPLAKKVCVKINEDHYQMERSASGIFKTKIKGDLDGSLYTYLINLDDEVIESIDPYGKSSNANSEKSAVIDFDKTIKNLNSDKLSAFANNCEAIIYETHIRDFTISKENNIKNKGKFLGFTEENCISKGKNHVGLSYLKDLGITHVQLLPVLDYGSVDELSTNQYNWGYDVVQMFTLEGSYSTNPNDPYCRINEFKQLISSLHKNNIRVNLDVVFNHVYKIEEFSLNKITPNYFFRIEGDKLANHSGCGNDFATERVMGRKFILDSILFLLKEYDIDGFRFDLMGLIDVETMNEVERKVHEIKPNAMIYGEGWDMYCTSKYAKQFANLKNAQLMPNIAHFNDSYRNILRGLGLKAELDKPGYLLGNNEFDDGFKFAFFAGTKDIVFPKLFSNYNQTVNYVECHDNATLFDMISASTNIDDKLRVIKLFNKVLLLTPGIVFIHMGQEFGQTKKFHANTYNMPDTYNEFNPNLMDQRMDLVASVKNNIAIRKSLGIFKEPITDKVNNMIEIKKEKPYFEAVLHDLSGNYHLIINKNENPQELNGLEYSKMVPYSPYKNVLNSENINAQKIGIAQRKCSIFKEL